MGSRHCPEIIIIININPDFTTIEIISTHDQFKMLAVQGSKRPSTVVFCCCYKVLVYIDPSGNATIYYLLLQNYRKRGKSQINGKNPQWSSWDHCKISQVVIFAFLWLHGGFSRCVRVDNGHRRDAQKSFRSLNRIPDAALFFKNVLEACDWCVHCWIEAGFGDG